MTIIEELTNTGSLVRALINTLPRNSLTIYMDNYFTSVPLFSSLRSNNFGAIGTTRPLDKFPSELAQLKKDNMASKLEWNTLFIKVVDNTLYFT